MTPNCAAPEETVTVADLAERWILTEAAAKRLVRSAAVPWIGDGTPGVDVRWEEVHFALGAIRRWEADHQIVYWPPSDCDIRPGGLDFP
jgi:hypothetical protein